MKKYIISCIPALIVMVVIFAFSAQPASISGTNSLFMAESVVDLTEGFMQNFDASKFHITKIVEVMIRKGAHATEYAILAICVSYHFAVMKREKKLRMWFTFLWCTLYAMTDEIHQLFVNGRTGRLTDVMIDAVGATFGILIFHIILKQNAKRVIKK